MNHLALCCLLALSGFAAPSALLHAKEPESSPYRLSASILQEGRNPNRPYGASEARQDDARPYAQQIAFAANAAGLDPELVHAVISVESAYQANAVSSKGAIGLMQLMPATARSHGSDHPAEVSANLQAGTRHLKSLLTRFDQSLELALAAYNAGEGAVRRYANNVPPFAETRHYVPTVIARYRANSQATSSPVYQKKRPEIYLSGTRLEPGTLSKGF
jgi:soluble lytic murein transglycosylase-like protein